MLSVLYTIAEHSRTHKFAIKLVSGTFFLVCPLKFATEISRSAQKTMILESSFITWKFLEFNVKFVKEKGSQNIKKQLETANCRQTCLLLFCRLLSLSFPAPPSFALSLSARNILKQTKD